MSPPPRPSSAPPPQDPIPQQPKAPGGAESGSLAQRHGSDSERPARPSSIPTSAEEPHREPALRRPTEAQANSGSPPPPARRESIADRPGDGYRDADRTGAAEPDPAQRVPTSAERAPAGPSEPGAAPHHALAPAWLRDLAGAWMFYSVLPAWPAPAPRFQRIARFAPWIGAVLGGLQGLLWWLLQGHAPTLTQVCLVLAAGLWLSGGLHMDGAMDTADGLAAGERLLEAMADSRVGANGVQALVLLLLLRAAALAWLGPLAPLALVWAAVWGRLAPLIAMARFPYLREQGSAAFHRRHWAGLGRELRPALPLVAALALLTWNLRGPGVLSVGPALLGLLPAVLVPLWLGRRLGGHSGDSYGACVEWSESLALLVMAGLPLGSVRG